MYQVVFQFENGDSAVTAFGAPDTTLLEAARGANVAIDAPCSGNGSCGKCRVKVLEGEVQSTRSPHLSEEEYADGWRLSCDSRLIGDVTVLVPDIASAYRSRMKTADLSSGEELAAFLDLQENLADAGIGIVNGFAALTVDLPTPTMDDTLPDNERLSRAMQTAGYAKTELSYFALCRLAAVMHSADCRIKVVGEEKDGTFTVYDVLPAVDDKPLVGCAIDIGTTTVTGTLLDLKTGKILAKASAGNGQIRYGADVINRIIEQGKPGGVKKLQDAVLQETLVPLIAAMCEAADIGAERILRVSIAANTTMNHLLLGVDASSVRMEPYIPSFFRFDGLLAGDLGFPANPNARVLLAPNIGSYVGGDITAGAFASRIWDQDEFSLFVDLGTNGELVFGNRDFLVACACSAGPAFEGGDISCGMRATDGAIEAVKIDKDTLEPMLTVVGGAGQKPAGICGSGIIDVVAELFRTNVISAKGKFQRESSRIRHDRHGIGRYVLAAAAESAAGREIAITEVDIESLIRAKGAIYSAIRVMLSTVDMDESVLSHVYVAGGIGSGINMENAVRIGMLPDIDRSLFRYVGNTALAGAYAMALSDEADKKVQELASGMTYLELSSEPRYMDEFVAACFLPHTDGTLFPSGMNDL